MLPYRTNVKCTSILYPGILCLLMLLTSCTQSATNPSSPTKTPTATQVLATTLPTAVPTRTNTPDTSPTRFVSQIVSRGVGRPDDLAFDPQGHLLFSDFYNGTISRLNTNGTVTILLSGIAGPEGLIVLSDGTMIIAEQRTNRILILAPGEGRPSVLRTLPGIPSTANCKDGVDGIAYDFTTKTIIVPDSPTGDVYRMSLDGQKLTLLATGIVRPVGATVDAAGTIYVADECGGAVWRIPTSGKTTRIGGFGMLDDVAFDAHGNLLVIDLAPSIHALIRLRLGTNKHEMLSSKEFIEPQGLAIDSHDNIFVSDDYANIIMELKPA